MKSIRIRALSNFLGALSIVTTLLVSSSLWALDNGSMYMEVEGKPGVWLPEALSQKILADVEELSVLRPQLKLMESRLELRGERIEDLELAIDLSMKAEKRSTDALQTAIQAKQRAEDKLSAWYRHPALWTAVGIVLTVVIEVAAIRIIREVRD